MRRIQVFLLSGFIFLSCWLFWFQFERLKFADFTYQQTLTPGHHWTFSHQNTVNTKYHPGISQIQTTQSGIVFQVSEQHAFLLLADIQAFSLSKTNLLKLRINSSKMGRLSIFFEGSSPQIQIQGPIFKLKPDQSIYQFDLNKHLWLIQQYDMDGNRISSEESNLEKLPLVQGIRLQFAFTESSEIELSKLSLHPDQAQDLTPEIIQSGFFTTPEYSLHLRDEIKKTKPETWVIPGWTLPDSKRITQTEKPFVYVLCATLILYSLLLWARLMPLNAFNILLLVLSIFASWFFSIEENHYKLFIVAFLVFAFSQQFRIGDLKKTETKSTFDFGKFLSTNLTWAVLLIVISMATGTLEHLSWSLFVADFPIYLLWAGFQQWIFAVLALPILSHYGPGPKHAPLIAAFLFALSHFPNLFLSLLTWFAAVYWYSFYQKNQRIWPIIISHAVWGSLITQFLPTWMLRSAQTGLSFFQ